MSRAVAVYFYGSYINDQVLAESGITLTHWDAARLDGFDIVIAPRANLVPKDGASVYGILTQVTHEQLERLYHHARTVLGETYLPEAVMVTTNANRQYPALCYICHDMVPRSPDPAYVSRILTPGRKYGFPEAYLARIEATADVG